MYVYNPRIWGHMFPTYRGSKNPGYYPLITPPPQKKGLNRRPYEGKPNGNPELVWPTKIGGFRSSTKQLSKEKGGPNGCLGDLLGMKHFPIMRGLFHKPLFQDLFYKATSVSMESARVIFFGGSYDLSSCMICDDAVT